MRHGLSTKDVAAELQLSEETIREYVREGIIPVERTPGGHARFRLADVKAALSLRVRPRRFAPIKPGEVRFSTDANPAGHPRGSMADDRRIGALELAGTEDEAPRLPTWPGRPGSTRVVGQRTLVEA